ncbi:low molecular weight phosphotyrosine protein phosphatase [Shewanella rhizosphaerae]|uniref:low molecular weight protein-tyrosine-phosphatase n=1 Tax=Shewanella rhizosphaerae TaxID=2864207 RepID=UPI001C65D5DD|nr:low molecular weight protein-tyrosine-phosphatase [Shewanella rhizosphaerae]QYK14431.1 low molecular weight phosphotyrosine protein phosphatase [Shewanella rhizosphaerae]
MSKVNSVLFVCLGNICRSPTAEAVFRGLLSERGLSIGCDSAGTSAYHEGEGPDRRARLAGERRGLDFSGIRARGVTDEDFERFDLILAADKANLRDLRARCPAHHQYKLALMLSFLGEGDREVPDPYYGGDDGFEQVLDLLQQSCEELLSQIAK